MDGRHAIGKALDLRRAAGTQVGRNPIAGTVRREAGVVLHAAADAAGGLGHHALPSGLRMTGGCGSFGAGKAR